MKIAGLPATLFALAATTSAPPYPSGIPGAHPSDRGAYRGQGGGTPPRRYVPLDGQTPEDQERRARAEAKRESRAQKRRGKG